jgi:hypothetical protein
MVGLEESEPRYGWIKIKPNALEENGVMDRL